jgi:stage III sporulation protein AE
VLLALAVFVMPAFGAREPDGAPDLEEELIKSQMESSGIGAIEEQMEKYSNEDINEIIKDYNPERIIESAVSGRLEFNFKSIANNIFRYLFKEIYVNVGILVKLMVLIIMCAILKNLQDSFMREGIGEVAFYVCYIVIVSILLVSFNTSVSMAKSIIDQMVGFMFATLPAIVTLLAAGGNYTAGVVFQPMMLAVVEVSAVLLKDVFIPLIFFSTILSVVNNISNRIQISRLTNLIRQVAMWALGIILAVFIGTVTVQGSLGAVIDGVTSKTAKFAITAFIPVVGKTLSDAADTVIGCTLLIKNAAGLGVMIGVLAICLVPLIKILAVIIMYKGLSALAEPVSDKRITRCISDIAGAMLHILGVVATVAFMFLITTTALVSAGNISAMIR